ncbi:MAG: amidohydrolase family protein [Clostridia bacterium]|nr:amidohydrolase family protein [Clostridia bacterium]
MIFANHAHLYPRELREDGAQGVLMRLLDDCGIDKAVAFAPFSHRFRESAQFHDVNQNVWLAGEIAGNDRLVGFGTVDVLPDAAPIAQQVQQIFELGLRGIKIHPAAQELPIDSARAFEIYEKAQELGLFLSFHTGLHWHRIRDYRMLLFDEIAYSFPDLNFSMEHVGGYSFFREALLVMCNNSRNPHTFAGLTSVEPEPDGLCGPWALTNEEIETLVFQAGEGRTVFGLDFPFKKADYIRRAMARIRALRISEEEKENILGRTLEKQLFGSEVTQ